MATRAHTTVISQPALVEVGVAQRLLHTDPLVRVKRQHFVHEVDGLVGGPLAEAVQGRDVGPFRALGQHVLFGALARVLEVGEGGGAEQVRDQVELSDGTGGLK